MSRVGRLRILQRVVLLGIFSSNGLLLSAQKFENFINSYNDENAQVYLRPLSELVTANINTGIREWSSVDSNFRIKLGLVVTASVPTAGMRHFTAQTGLGFEPVQSARVPTIIGPNEAVSVGGDNGTVFIFPVGYNLSFLPLAVPQLTLGGLFYSEISVRYFGIDPKEEIGRIDIFGLGGRHQLNQYFRSLPFDLSVGYFYQRFRTEPYIFSYHHLVSGHIGKSYKNWSTMVTLGFQTSSTTFEYYRQQSANSYVVHVRGTNPFFAELSAAVKLWVFQFRLYASYAGPWTGGFGMNVRI